MPNIAFISNYFGIGGMERTFLSIAENLRKKNYSFHFINLADDFFQDRFRKSGKCFHSTDFSAVIQYLINEKIDIVQSCNCDDGSYLAYLAGIRTIIERPDGFSSAFLSDKTPVSTIVCSTSKVFDKAKKMYPEKHIELIHNGVDTNIFRSKGKNEKLLNQLNISPKDIVIGYCGRIAESKCLDRLIDVFAKISAKNPNCKLIILGGEFPHNSGYKRHLENKVKELLIDNKTLFLEATEHPEKILTLFDIAVLCSGSFKLPDGSYEVEGIPNSIMESMSSGVPSVATDSGETNLLVKNNETGFIAGVNEWDKFQEKLEILINNSNLRQKMGLSAKKHIKTNFSIDKMIDEYDQLYRFSLNPDFNKKYPEALNAMKRHFLSNEFKPETEDIHNKKILIIKSANNYLFYNLTEKIKKHFNHPDISILINKNNYDNLRNAYHKETFFVYDKSAQFSLELMNDIIKKINEKNFDCLFFLFNDLQGKNYKNVIDIVYAVKARQKIVFNNLRKMFIFD